MAEPTLQLGGGKWAGKTDNLLGYYKEGKRFYKQDFTFSRSTTGTYTDSDGYIQEMPYNLLQQSNDFDTTWTTTNASVTGGQSGYDGSNDAWLLNESAVGGRVLQSISGSGVMTMSLYAKSGTLDFILVYINTTGTDPFAYFDLTNGDVSTSGASSRISASAVAVGDGWYRLSVTGNVGTLSSIEIYPANSLSSHTASAGSIYIQNSQLNKGSSAKTYFPTTTRLNMPRVDYLNNSNGSLILEPQRTNLMPYSEDFSEWTGASTATITTNYTTSPEGVNNATRLQFAASSNLKHEQIIAGAYESQSITVSVYAKSLTGNDQDFRLKCTHANVTDYFSNDLTATDEWQRFVFTQAFGSSTGTGIVTGIFQATDNLAKDIAFYGYQVEANASYATSIIPTNGASVTRNADTLNLLNVSNVIGQSEGTLFFDANFNTADSFNISLSDSTSSNYISIDTTSVKSIFARVQSGGSTQATINTAGSYFQDGDRLKCAIAYKANDFAFYINGTQIGTNTSGSVPTTDDIRFARFNGSLAAHQSVNEFKLYNTRLTNTELATLTTL